MKGINLNLIVYLITIVCVYIFPSMVAVGKKNTMGIVIFNLLLGWTLLGWIGAFIWACYSPRNEAGLLQNRTTGDAWNKRIERLYRSFRAEGARGKQTHGVGPVASVIGIHGLIGTGRCWHLGRDEMLALTLVARGDE